MPPKFALNGLLCVMVASLLWANGSVAAESLTAYRGATLIDGRGGDVIENATLLVEGERFKAVGGADLPIPDGVNVIDMEGRWIVPGLIDAHIHFMTSGRMYTRPAFFLT